MSPEAPAGRLDVLVNNAGIMTRGAFADAPVTDYAAMWAVNVTGTFLCTQYALRPMVQARYGRVVNLSSQLARAGVGSGGFAAYAATKGAIEAFTRAIALEYGGHGITVNAIAPGGIDTDMSRAVMTAEYRARRIQELPVKHLGMRTSIDAAGRLVIPKAICREAGLRPGVPLEIRWEDGRIEIEPAPLPVKLVRRGRLLVAQPQGGPGRLDQVTVEKTRRALRREPRR